MPIIWNLQEWLRTERGLTNPTDIKEVILKRTGYQIAVPTLQKLFSRQPQVLQLNGIQVLCDAFRCQLSDFCQVTATSPSPTDTLFVNLSLQPCFLTETEDLPSFIARVQLAAISEAAAIEGNHTKAAQRLGYHRPSLITLRTRLQARHNRTNSKLNTGKKQSSRNSNKPIPLPLELFRIRPTETLYSFVERVQLATIIEATAIEGSHTQAARRLGYQRSALVTLLARIKKQHPNETAGNRDLK